MSFVQKKKVEELEQQAGDGIEGDEPKTAVRFVVKKNRQGKLEKAFLVESEPGKSRNEYLDSLLARLEEKSV